jgi:RNA polymerase sigma-70 factor, ECF subfamily
MSKFESAPTAAASWSVPSHRQERGNARLRTQRRVRKLRAAGPAPANVIDQTKAAPAANEDRRLIELARAGDSDALSTLFAQDREKLYRAAFALLRNKEDAEDALQDGLLSAYLHLGSFEGRARFSTWLTRIILNSALMKRRRTRMRLRYFLPDREGDRTRELIAQAVDGRPDPEQTFAWAETQSMVEKEASRLSPFLRSAFYFRELNELSTSEAAKAVGVNVAAVKSRSARARHQVLNLLASKGVDQGHSQFLLSRRASAVR